MSDTQYPVSGDTAWFEHDRFGLFIHWGIYALPARHEWVKSREQISDADYQKYFDHFYPDLYDPGAWADLAAGAGMKYFVITTKHHDGFCLWDSDLTDWKATRTPWGQDLLAPMVDAFRQRDLKVGFYHSLIDWHHPQYVIDSGNHPQRNHPDRAALNVGRDQMKYADYLHGQVRELLTRYGKVDVMWFDYSFPCADDPTDHTRGKSRHSWRSEELLALVRELMPDVMLDDRLDLPGGFDIKTPEQYQPRRWIEIDGKPVRWEACQTFSGSWGYYRDEESWKSVEMLVEMLIDTVSKGGNLLLNVGPNARGEFDYRAQDRLRGMGDWMRLHQRAIYGCTAAPADIPTPQDCRLTWNPQTRRLYVHVLAWPFKHLHLDGLGDKVAYAQLLNDASELPITTVPAKQQALQGGPGPNTLTLTLPVKPPPVTVPVIELILKG